MNCIILLVTFTVVTTEQILKDDKTEEKIEDKTELLKKWNKECIEKTKVSPIMINKLKSGDWKINNVPLKHWTLCMLTKYKLMTNEGVFKLDTALSMVPQIDKATIDNFISECLPKIALKPQEAAWRYVKCYYTKLRSTKNTKLHYFTLFL